MRKLLLAFTVCTFCLLSGFNTVRASHIMGGELTYHWISGNDYQLTLTLYRDCNGISAPSPSTEVYVYSSCGANILVTMMEISNTNITPACDMSLTCVIPNTIGYPGVEKHVYTGMVTLPGTCSDYVFYWTSCCRNAAITNLANASGFGATFYATLDNTATPFNNSPVFANDPVIYLFAGQSYHLNNGMYDADGDSLVISMVNPIADNALGGPLTALPCAYNPPFTYSNPVTSTPPLSIDASTGEILVTPQNVEVDVWAYIVDEYRNGVLIGSITRDVQMVIQPGSDQLPELSGVNGYPVFTTSVCAGDSLTFSFNTSDPDSADSTSIAWHYFGQPNYTMSITAGQNESAMFGWATDSTMISPTPYLLYVSVKDNACPYYGLQTYVYQIYVNQCITNDVWPGDANSDLQCNMYDILPIGIAYGQTGPARAGASLTWVAQPATPWGNNLASGVNIKHADCDGNGTIDSLDLAAITLNFGSTHNKGGASNDPYINTIPDLNISYSVNPAPVGAPVTAFINLGNSTLPLSDVYGVVFSLNYDPNMFQLGSMSYNDNYSYLGNSGNMLKMIHGVIDFGSIEVGMVRKDQISVNGNGEIARMNFIANPLIQGDVTFNMGFSNARVITNDGDQIPVNIVNNNPITISQLLNVNDISSSINFVIKPNQVKDVMAIDYSLVKGSNVNIAIYNMIGEQVKQVINENQNTGKHHLNVSSVDLPKGAYLVRLITDNGVVTQRIIKL
ncbi:MAG: T9SS type A sorting domain-containing protein [Bacteroidia bacterium]